MKLDLRLGRLSTDSQTVAATGTLAATVLTSLLVLR
jgi:hypothetical protein